MSARGFIGAGDVYMNPIVGGVAQGWVGPFESTKFEIKPNVDKKEQVSKGKSTYGQVIETVNLPKPADFTVEFSEVNKSTMATALYATASAFNQGAGDAADEAVVAKLDVWVPLAHVRISTEVVTNSGASTTYVNGTDYIVNEELGWFKALSTGAIIADQALKVDYHYAAVTGTDLAGATLADVRAKFRFDGVNQVDGLPCIADVYEAVIAADSAFDFLKDDFNSVSLPGRMKTPAGFTKPFNVRLLDTVAS